MNRWARLPLMIVSFALSVLLWTYVQSQQDAYSAASPTISVPITVENMPPNLVLMNKLPTYNVIPEGAPEDIRQVSAEDLTAVLDLTGATPGTARYPVRLVPKKNLQVTFSRQSSTLQVTLDRLVSGVVKPVVVLPRGSLPDPNLEYVRKNTTTDPAFVYVSGPKSLVDKVDHALAVLELRTAANGQLSTSPVTLVDQQDFPVTGANLEFQPQTVIIRPSIAYGPETKLVLVSPAFKGAPAFGYRVKRIVVQPNQIEVKGRSEALSDLSVVSTPVIDISGARATTQFDAQATLPGDVTATTSTAVVVTVVIEPAPAAPAKPNPTGGGR